MKLNTGILATPARLDILGSVIGQLSDGIWENSRYMEKYWKSLTYGTLPDGNIYIEDRYNACTDPVKFMADKIKQIIKEEIKDGYTAGLEWSRMCSIHPAYMHGSVTAGECYELYELLKGRDISKNIYSKLQQYTVRLSVAGHTITVIKVEATSILEAKQLAVKKYMANIQVDIV